MHESARYVEHLFDASTPGIVLLAVVLGLAGLAVAAGSYVQSKGEAWNLVSMLQKSAVVLWMLPAIFVFALIGTRFSEQRMPIPEPTTGVSTQPVSHVPGAAAAPVEPSWLHDDVIDGPGHELVVVHGRQFATVEEAQRDALGRTVALVRDVVVRSDRRLAEVRVPDETVGWAAVRAQYVEPIVRTTGNAEFTVYRVHQQVDLSAETLRRVTPVWSRAAAVDRLWILGTAAGFLGLTFGVLAGYLRLDEVAGGRHRGRLRFAAASLVTAFGLTAALLL